MFQFSFHKKSSEFNLQIAASNQTSQSLNAEPYFSAYCRLPTAYWLLVRKGGLEPPHLSVPDPKSGASANSATFAKSILYRHSVWCSFSSLACFKNTNS